MEADIKKIIDDLNEIKSEIHDIKVNMPNKDIFLSSEEAKLLEESYENEKKGKLTSSNDLRKELGL